MQALHLRPTIFSDQTHGDLRGFHQQKPQQHVAMVADVFEHRWEDNPAFHSYYPAKGESRVQYSEGVFVGYRHYDRSETKPLFPFGFELSYTTFTYSNVSVTPASGNLDQPVTVSFEVNYVGRREGAGVAELYVGDPHASVPRPVKELKGFAKVNLKPARGAQTVTYALTSPIPPKSGKARSG